MAETIETTGTTETEVITDQDRQILVQVEQILIGLRNKLIEAAPLLAQLSKPGLREAKKRFKGFIGAEHIDRLVAFSRGDFPEYLAIRCKSMRLGYFLKLKKKSKEMLRNPNSEVILATPNGPITKLASTCNAVELLQAFDPRFDGIVPEPEQRKLFKTEKLSQEKDDPTVRPVEEFRISVIPGTEWLIITIDGQRFKISGRQFRRESRFFR
jgi:hypothetical protein